MSQPTAVAGQGAARLANETWESLLQVHTTLMKGFVAESIWDELSMREYDVVFTLSKCPEPVRLNDLLQHVLLSQPALSRLVGRLVSRGLVRRGSDPSDARGRLISLTGEGLAAQRRVGRRHARSVASVMTEALTRDELVELRQLCQTLAQQDGYQDGRRNS